MNRLSLGSRSLDFETALAALGILGGAGTASSAPGGVFGTKLNLGGAARPANSLIFGLGSAKSA